VFNIRFSQSAFCPRPTRARNSGRAEQWIARGGWVPRRGASCRQLGRGDRVGGCASQRPQSTHRTSHPCCRCLSPELTLPASKAGNFAAQSATLSGQGMKMLSEALGKSAIRLAAALGPALTQTSDLRRALLQ